MCGLTYTYIHLPSKVIKINNIFYFTQIYKLDQIINFIYGPACNFEQSRQRQK